MKRTLVAALVLLAALPSSAASTVPAPHLAFVTPSADGQDLVLRLDGAGTDPAALQVLLDGSPYLSGAASPKKLVTFKDGTSELRLSGFRRIAGAFAVSKTHAEYVEGSGVQTLNDGTTATVKVRRGSDVAWRRASTETRNDLATGVGTEVLVLKASASLLPPLPSDAEALHSYALAVNGSTVQLTPVNGPLVRGQYAVDGDTVSFPSANLPNRVNSVALLVDGVPSNYFAFQRRADWINSLDHVEFVQEGDVASMRAFFFKGPSLFNVDNLDVLVDGGAVPKKDAAVFGNQIIVKVPLSRFSATTKSATFQVRDPITGLASDPYAINLEKFIHFQIPSVTLSVLGGRAEFRIPMEAGSLMAFGSLGKLSVNLNGLDYGPLGTVEKRKDASGAVITDAAGIERSDLVRVAPIRPGNGYLEFDLPATALTGANVLTFTNGTLQWTTPAYAFDAKGRPTAAPADAPKPEKATFVPADSLDKRLDFVNQDPDALPIGSLHLDNLDPAASYELSFNVYSDADWNPFSSVSYGGEPLVTATDAKGKAAFGYFRRAKGADFSAAADIAWKPSGTASGGPVALTLGDVVLKRVDIDSRYAPLLSIGTAGTASVSWTYDFGNCWDGGTQFCEAAGLRDPFVAVKSLSVAGQSAIGVPVASAVPVPASPVPVIHDTPSTAKAGVMSLAAEEPMLTRVQKNQAAVVASRLAEAITRLAKGDAARAKRTGVSLAAAIEARLSTLGDVARRAYLRAVAANLRSRFQ